MLYAGRWQVSSRVGSLVDIVEHVLFKVGRQRQRVDERRSGRRCKRGADRQPSQLAQRPRVSGAVQQHLALSVGQHAVSDERLGVEPVGGIGQQTQQLVVRTQLPQLQCITQQTQTATMR